MSQDIKFTVAIRKQAEDGRHTWQVRAEYPTARGAKRDLRYLPPFRGTVREAEAHKRELTRSHASEPAGLQPRRVTVAEACRDHIANRLANNRIIASTAESQRALVEAYIAPSRLGGILLADVAAEDLEAFMRKLAPAQQRGGKTVLAPATRQRVRSQLNQTLKQAVRTRAIAYNVVAMTDPPRLAPRRPRALELDALRRLVDTAPAHMRPLLTVAISTGLRRGEVCGLEWGDIDLDASPPTLRVRQAAKEVAGVLEVGTLKTQAATRAIPLTADLAELFRGLLLPARETALQLGVPHATRPVFPGPDGGVMHPRALSMRFARLAARAGLPGAKLHDLRHSFATHGWRATGGNWHLIGARLGHANVTTTMAVYGHLLAKDAATVVDPWGGAGITPPAPDKSNVTPLRGRDKPKG